MAKDGGTGIPKRDIVEDLGEQSLDHALINLRRRLGIHEYSKFEMVKVRSRQNEICLSIGISEKSCKLDSLQTRAEELRVGAKGAMERFFRYSWRRHELAGETQSKIDEYLRLFRALDLEKTKGHDVQIKTKYDAQKRDLFVIACIESLDTQLCKSMNSEMRYRNHWLVERLKKQPLLVDPGEARAPASKLHQPKEH